MTLICGFGHPSLQGRTSSTRKNSHGSNTLEDELPPGHLGLFMAVIQLAG